MEKLPELFSSKHKKKAKDGTKLQEELYKQIGQLKVELDWLKKNLKNCVDKRKKLVDSGHKKISITRQCQLLGLPRSSFYYKATQDDSRDVSLMNLTDEIYTKHPYFGVRIIKKRLEKEDEIGNRKKIRRIMREMGIYAIYPKPNLSLPNKEHLKYPYLLRNLNINKADQVWASDIYFKRIRDKDQHEWQKACY